MYITCLDLEGVLVPEIWIAFAEASGIPELKRTTRDEPDYDKLMNWRLGILKEHGLGLKEIQETIAKIDPIPGAKEFLDELRSIGQVIIISDTFSQFAGPLMKKLGYPTIFCNELIVADDGEITGFKMRCPQSKLTTVKALQIAYCSLHGNTEKAAKKLAEILEAKGAPKVAISDLSRDDMAECIEDAFRYDRLVLAAPTYDGGVMPVMADFINHLKMKAYQKRKVAFIENGSWAPMAAKLMKEQMSAMKDIEIVDEHVTIRSAFKQSDVAALEALAGKLL